MWLCKRKKKVLTEPLFSVIHISCMHLMLLDSDFLWLPEYKCLSCCQSINPKASESSGYIHTSDRFRKQVCDVMSHTNILWDPL
uniref:Uncharacterized protein n=1 Tax=Anabas testudineus TaxID=64144 RepID=A0A3Q1IRW2_ANATE